MGYDSGPAHPDTQVEHVYVLTGDSRETFDRVTRHLADVGLAVSRVQQSPPAVWVRGAAGAVNAALGVSLRRLPSPTGARPGLLGPPPVPDALAGDVHAVLGLDTQHVMSAPGFGGLGSPLLGPNRTVVELAEQYNFPAGTTGAGQKVGIVLLGGGIPDISSTFDDYFSSLCLKTPTITVSAVGGASNDPADIADIEKALGGYVVPGSPLVTCSAGEPAVGPLPAPPPAPCAEAAAVISGGVTAGIAGEAEDCSPPTPDAAKDQINWTCEGIMDVELVGGAAPGCEIIVYVCPNTAKGIFTAFTQALQDGVDVLTCSWGSAEFNLAPSYFKALDSALMALSQKGVTICVSSGDRGSTPRAPACSKLAVSFPASSQYVLACGGNMRTQDIKTGVDVDIVWREGSMGMYGSSGGGFSAHTPMPAWQTKYGVSYPNLPNSPPMRGVPDVCSESSYQSGIWLFYSQLNIKSAGTSAAAPVWAGLVTRLNEGLKARVGNLSEHLYAPSVAATFVDVVAGDSSVITGIDAYEAQQGWDPCTGLGRPDGAALLTALQPLIPGA